MTVAVQQIAGGGNNDTSGLAGRRRDQDRDVAGRAGNGAPDQTVSDAVTGKFALPRCRSWLLEPRRAGRVAHPLDVTIIFCPSGPFPAAASRPAISFLISPISQIMVCPFRSWTEAIREFHRRREPTRPGLASPKTARSQDRYSWQKTECRASMPLEPRETPQR